MAFSVFRRSFLDILVIQRNWPRSETRLIMITLQGKCFVEQYVDVKKKICYLQEILLKRAADLVEALYGNPHSNQVTTLRTSAVTTCSVIVLHSAVWNYGTKPIRYDNMQALYCSFSLWQLNSCLAADSRFSDLTSTLDCTSMSQKIVSSTTGVPDVTYNGLIGCSLLIFNFRDYEALSR